jgi:hypothetical protein
MSMQHRPVDYGRTNTNGQSPRAIATVPRMKTSVLTRRALRAAMLALVTVVTACESETDPAGPDNTPIVPVLNEILSAGPLNASATDTLIHFSLATSTVVSRTADWDVAFRRYEVRLNGGISGTKGVTGVALDNNKNATAAEVLAMTVANTATAFDAVREPQIPADGAFQSDRLIENTTAYLNLSGIPSANAAAYWKVRTATGAYALMRVSAIALSQSFALTSITVESRLETAGVLGAPQTAVVTVGAQPVSISLSANGAVTPAGCNWDLRLNPATFDLSVNTACNAGTYPAPASPAFASATAAGDAVQYAAFLSGMTGPIPNSISDTGAPFRYNLEGNNRLSPAFNTYLVKSGEYVYKLQLVNYYSDAGASGYPTIRYARIR